MNKILYFFNKNIVNKFNRIFYLLKQLKISTWAKIAFYLVLDYVFAPADLVYKFFPDAPFTNILAVASNGIFYAALYIFPEIREVGKN